MTEKEIEAMLEANLKKIRKAREAIESTVGKWKKGGPACGGNMDCPICGATKSLDWRRASNGHIRAACSTQGCVWWME